MTYNSLQTDSSQPTQTRPERIVFLDRGNFDTGNVIAPPLPRLAQATSVPLVEGGELQAFRGPFPLCDGAQTQVNEDDWSNLVNQHLPKSIEEVNSWNLGGCVTTADERLVYEATGATTNTGKQFFTLSFQRESNPSQYIFLVGIVGSGMYTEKFGYTVDR